MASASKRTRDDMTYLEEIVEYCRPAIHWIPSNSFEVLQLSLKEAYKSLLPRFSRIQENVESNIHSAGKHERKGWFKGNAMISVCVTARRYGWY